MLFIIGGLPLLIYPFVLLANLMAIAGFGAGNVDYDVLLIVVLLFILSSSSYPLTYIVCWIHFFKKGNKRMIVAIIPLLHICATLLFGFLWGFIEKIR